ncbi:hypothetical protein [Novosphingobium sp. Leaf2]|uniref:hypothetical protein n=1 Tax=Novosphingobium sp. Leaf2 TaxID=1735670 RepID=UPI0006F7D245|nr:hypothetical protein [Novosphingobium sp. Leaf2]KQM13893.1 hypothetical protein ASE49_12730 [Novosphingobium sp. Leaf2]
MTQQLVAGRTLAEWNQQWQPLEHGLSKRHDELRETVGVFRFRRKDEVVYIGCAREYAKGGLRKRLSDFTRPGDSGRTHYAGQKIYENREHLEVDVIVTGTDYKAGWTALRLKGALLGIRQPIWNATRT